jgi:hypothetical protein
VAAICRPQAVDSVTPGRRRRNDPATANFTGRFAAVHRDAPVRPQVAHIPVHKDVLTARDTGPSFARQESPGSGSPVTSGEGGRTARSEASGCSPCRFDARGPPATMRTAVETGETGDPGAAGWPLPRDCCRRSCSSSGLLLFDRSDELSAVPEQAHRPPTVDIAEDCPSGWRDVGI